MPKTNYNSFRRSLEQTHGIKMNDNRDYDYEGFFNENPEQAMRIAQGDKSIHFPDTYKLPTHPTFSTESKYSNSNTPGGTWVKDNEGNWIFVHSPFTAKHLEKTDDYLGENVNAGGPVEISYYDGVYRLPTITVLGKKSLKNKK